MLKGSKVRCKEGIEGVAERSCLFLGRSVCDEEMEDGENVKGKLITSELKRQKTLGRIKCGGVEAIVNHIDTLI